MDGKSYYDYDVSGKVPINMLYERNEIKAQDIKMFLLNVLDIIAEAERDLSPHFGLLRRPRRRFTEAHMPSVSSAMGGGDTACDGKA